MFRSSGCTFKIVGSNDKPKRFNDMVNTCKHFKHDKHCANCTYIIIYIIFPDD